MGVYTAYINNVSVTGAITLVQLKAGATSSCEILRAWCSQETLDASDQQPIDIVRKSVAATVTSFTPLLIRPTDAVADAVGGTAATGTDASVEGTDTDIVHVDCFNILNGWFYVPVPEERIWVAPAGIIGLRFPIAPGSAMDVFAGFVWREIG